MNMICFNLNLFLSLFFCIVQERYGKYNAPFSFAAALYSPEITLVFIPDWVIGIHSLSFHWHFIKSFLILFYPSVSILKCKFRHNNAAQVCWSQVGERATSCCLYIIHIIYFFFNKGNLMNFNWQHSVAPDLFFF